MKKLTTYELVALVLCAACIFFCFAWLFIRRAPSPGWQIYTQRQDAPLEHSHSTADTDGLLEGEIINLNTATRSDLLRLPNIGAIRAEDILSYRDTHGPFRRVDDLLNVPGIGPGTLEQLRAYISAE